MNTHLHSISFIDIEESNDVPMHFQLRKEYLISHSEVNVITADDLGTPGTSTLAAMILTSCAWNHLGLYG